MEVFKAISKIKYKDNIFCVLINKTCGIYYIKELEDGSIMYPTEDEYIELTNILIKKQELAFFKIGKNYRFDPKVIMRTGKLLALGTAVTLMSFQSIACVVKKDLPVYEETVQQTVEDIYRDLSNEFHSLYGYEDQRMYRIEKLVDTNAGIKFIECQNFDEFSKYIDTKANPTYEELRETLKNNENVSEKYKEWLFEGIDNLEKNMTDLNLTVLNYNFDRLKIIEKSLEDLNSRFVLLN